MKNTDMLRLMSDMHNEEVETRDTKGKEYSGTEDCLTSFKRLAKNLNLSPLQIWCVYFVKHVDAIINYCKEQKVYSEPIASRIMDARVYLALLRGLIEDMNSKTSTVVCSTDRQGDFEKANTKH